MTTLTDTVRIATNVGSKDVPGRIVAPGLALTPSVINDARHVITHLPSGVTLVYGRCPVHAQAAADMLTAGSFDWTRPAADLLADPACVAHIRAVHDRFPHQYGLAAVDCAACDGPIGGTR